MPAANNALKKNLVLFASEYPQEVSRQLSATIEELGYKIIPASIDAFKSSERFCELYKDQKELFVQNKKEITGSTVHVIADIGTDINKFFVDTINAVATAKEYGAKSIRVILPFTPFARQDRRFDSRMVSVMSKTFPKMLKAAGATQFATIDMHSKASEVFYAKTFGVENVQFLSALDLLAEQIKSLTQDEDKVQVGAPDGYDKPNDVAQARAAQFEKKVNGNGWTDYPNTFGIIKRHLSANKTCAELVAGRVKVRKTVLIDDMADTGGTLKNAAALLKAAEARETLAAFTHPILSDDSLSVLTSDTLDGEVNPIDGLVVMDTIMSIYDKVEALPENQKARVKIVSAIPLIRQALAFQPK